MLMNSITYGKVDVKSIANIIKEKALQYNYNCDITVGTDSQNISDYTKIVTVISIHFNKNGGIFFYTINKVKSIKNLRQKLVTETQSSLEITDELLKELENVSDNTFDYNRLPFCIHVDAGTNGDTKVLIKELTAWVISCGYKCEIKPDSFAASAIANKYSK